MTKKKKNCKKNSLKRGDYLVGSGSVVVERNGDVLMIDMHNCRASRENIEDLIYILENFGERIPLNCVGEFSPAGYEQESHYRIPVFDEGGISYMRFKKGISRL